MLGKAWHRRVKRNTSQEELTQRLDDAVEKIGIKMSWEARNLKHVSERVEKVIAFQYVSIYGIT